MAQVYAAREQYQSAITTYMEALQHSPESAELLTALGLLLLRAGDSQRAFDYLGTSLLHEPRSAVTILAAGSIIQVRGFACVEREWAGQRRVLLVCVCVKGGW